MSFFVKFPSGCIKISSARGLSLHTDSAGNTQTHWPLQLAGDINKLIPPSQTPSTHFHPRRLIGSITAVYVSDRLLMHA